MYSFRLFGTAIFFNTYLNMQEFKFSSVNYEPSLVYKFDLYNYNRPNINNN